MIRGIGGVPYIDMSAWVDLDEFDRLQPEIYRGFAEGRMYAKEGTWMKPGFDPKYMSYTLNWKPIFAALDEYLALPDDDPVKTGGWDLYCNIKDHETRNKFTRYLKMAMGAYDPYIYYFLWEEGSWDDRTAKRNLAPEAEFFPNVVKWVESLQGEVFEHLGRVMFFHREHDGIPFEHRDLDGNNGIQDYSDHRNEFIHIRPNTRAPFYIWDPETQHKVYINSRAAFWNDQDWHGGDRLMQQSYGMRIDGVFTEKFRNRTGIGSLDHY